MSRLWKNFSASRFSRYNLERLIDCRQRHEFPLGTGMFQVICDIDKTYLETRFETFVDMIQVALESATAKQTVEGAADILMAARWGDIYTTDTAPAPNGLHFVSSSPPQLRSVLEEKLMIDGLEWDSDTFKNQAYNLIKGKVSFLKQHIAYKSSAILGVIKEYGADRKVILIGDNAESDPLIYLGITLYLAGRLNRNEYLNYLSAAGADEQILDTFPEFLPETSQARVSGIIIRNAPGYTRKIPTFLASLIRTFDHFYETAFHLHNIGVITDHVLVKLTRDLHNYYGVDRSYLCSVIEAAHIGRSAPYTDVLQECMQALKVEADLKWKKDVSRDLTPFDFSAVEKMGPEEALAFAKEWRH